MKNREILLNLIKETERTEELTKKVIAYFKEKNYDMSIIMEKFKPLLEGNLDKIKDEEVSDLIVIFGGELQVDEELDETLENEIKDDINDNTPTHKTKTKNKNKNKLIESELYNELVIKNQSLEKELKNKDQELDSYKTKSEELEEKIQGMLDQMSKFNNMFELLRKFNITEKGELVKVEKEIVDEAYFVYTVENKTEHKNTFIIEKDDTINIVSEYYTIRK